MLRKYKWINRFIKQHWFTYIISATTDIHIFVLIWELWSQRQVPQAGISKCNPQYHVGCNYVSLPEIPASGTNVIICLSSSTSQFVKWKLYVYCHVMFLILETSFPQYHSGPFWRHHACFLFELFSNGVLYIDGKANLFPTLHALPVTHDATNYSMNYAATAKTDAS